MKHLLTPFLLTVLLLLRSVASANDSIDSFIISRMQSKHIPGAALVVIRNGKIIKSSNYGLANVELKVPVSSRTSFEIASMTKQFTAAAVLLLAEEGKVNLDNSVTSYLADLPETWKTITIRRLLNHTSGLRDDWDEGNEFFQTKTSDDAFLDALKTRPLEFQPGERFNYSCGPFVVGMIIARVSGMSYADFMRRRIFEPLGMSSTHVIDAAHSVPERAVGYVYRDNVLQKGVQISAAAHARADVGIETTVLDLAKWDNALDDERLLKQTSLKEMFSPAKLTNGESALYGLGWFLYPMRGRDVIQHGGGFRTGFNSTINKYPDKKLTIILLTNLFRAGANDLGHEIAGFYLPEFRSLGSRTPRRDPNSGRTAALHKMIDSLRAGRESVVGAASNFPYRFYVKDDWQELMDGATSFAFIGCDEVSKRAPFLGSRMSDVCYYKVSGKHERFLSFLFDESGKVSLIVPYEY